MDIRLLAYNLIEEWDVKKTYPNLSLKKALRSVSDLRDRRFITALVYGVVERKITLDHFINQCANRRVEKMSAAVRSVLRMGVYQMFYMNVPPSAACNTSVELIKKSGFAHSSSFVNGVLRSCARNKEQLLALKKADYSVRFSIDPMIVDLLLEQYGKETFLKIIDGISNQSNAIYLYHNNKKGDSSTFLDQLTKEGIKVTQTTIPNLYQSNFGFSVEESESFQNGWYHVVGKHSAEAALLMPKDAKIVLDLCAAPGGKTFIMATQTDGQIHSFDIHPHKVQLLTQSANRMGHTNVTADCADAAEYKTELKETADFVLCDVPCSGLGIMGKKPDIKYKSYESKEFTDLQYRILCNASDYLKQGGRLVYSTCTLDKRENEEQIQHFLKEHPAFSLDTQAVENGMQTFLPNIEADGFFIAALRKVNA